MRRRFRRRFWGNPFAGALDTRRRDLRSFRTLGIKKLIPGIFYEKPKRTDKESRFRNDWDGLSGQRVVLVGYVAYALVRHPR
jgi:hypothetical protein